MTWHNRRPVVARLRWAACPGLGFVGAVLILLAGAAPVRAQAGTDPRTEPIPALDFGQGAKAIVVRLEFSGRYNVTLSSTQVSLGQAHATAGNPPLLRVELFNDKDVMVQAYNEWHPLWANLYSPGGLHSRITLASASGRFVIPFAPDLKTMKVIDIADPNTPELIAVDLRPAIRAYCQANPADTDCPLGPGMLWVGLRNSDDQWTRFDLQVRVYRTLADPVEQPIATGLTRCITGLTRSPGLAKEIPVEFTTHVASPFAIRVFTRIGTNPDDTRCTGGGGSHTSAVGLRLYYDSATRASRVGNPALYLHGASGAGVLDTTTPTADRARETLSGGIAFPKGNPWKEVGTGWSQ
jgi:hypothetical protein